MIASDDTVASLKAASILVRAPFQRRGGLRHSSPWSVSNSFSSVVLSGLELAFGLRERQVLERERPEEEGGRGEVWLSCVGVPLRLPESTVAERFLLVIKDASEMDGCRAR